MEPEDSPIHGILPFVLFFLGMALLLLAIFGLMGGMGLPLLVIGTLLVIASLYLWKAHPF